MHGLPLIFALAAMSAYSPKTASLAVAPTDKPSMAVQVNTGRYTVLGHKVNVPSMVVAPVDPPERISVLAEEHVLEAKPEPYTAYIGGTTLAKTVGPIDATRLPNAIATESVVAHSEVVGGVRYVEGADYEIDHTWGTIWRTAASSIPVGAKVYVDYQVYQQRIDQVEMTGGKVSIRKGNSTSICPEIPVPGKGSIPLANIHVQFRAESISSAEIYPLPAKASKWQDYIKTSGKQHLTNTIGLLKAGKHVNVVC